MPKFPFYKQHDAMDCGPTCLRIISKFYEKEFSASFLQDVSNVDKIGTSMADLSDAAEQIGFRTLPVKIPFEVLCKEKPLPCIVHWRQNHYVVLYEADKKHVYVSDPAIGLMKYKKDDFVKFWITDKSDTGVALLLEPTPEFYNLDDASESEEIGFRHFAQYLRPHRKLFIQLIFGLIAGTIFSLLLPFLTQSLIDVGVQNNNLNFIYLVLGAQIAFFLGSTTVTVVRSWILLHISTRINISIISDFLVKLMKLPISFFDKKNMGDIMQRIRDHDRIKSFLTSSTLQSLFSLINILVYSAVLLTYSGTIFLIFITGAILYFAWIIFFLKRRKKIDHQRFNQAAASQSNEIQLVQGMQEIKLNHAEKNKRWEWEKIQVRLFHVSIASLTLEQLQSVGGSFINEMKNILVVFWSANEVINGDMTLGMMLAATQILGQLNSPLQQLIGFVQQAQDANISLERLGEIHNRKNEDDDTLVLLEEQSAQDLILENVSFRYGGVSSEMVLKDINLTIPVGKTTAIVGASGSGKTTLLKLLLKFYAPTSGMIGLGKVNLQRVNSENWRSRCGVVMQDGFIFSDSILNNISISSDSPDMKLFDEALDTANIRDFVYQLPLGYETKIGTEGIGLSQGQKQRLMIARSVYKNPDYLFFDEATSSLDAKNEKVITDRLNEFSSGRTSVIIAHRLSTVKNADQIIVLDKGIIAEQGTHKELTKMKGLYYELVKNQLELGK